MGLPLRAQGLFVDEEQGVWASPGAEDLRRVEGLLCRPRRLRNFSSSGCQPTKPSTLGPKPLPLVKRHGGSKKKT